MRFVFFFIQVLLLSVLVGCNVGVGSGDKKSNHSEESQTSDGNNLEDSNSSEENVEEDSYKELSTEEALALVLENVDGMESLFLEEFDLSDAYFSIKDVIGFEDVEDKDDLYNAIDEMTDQDREETEKLFAFIKEELSAYVVEEKVDEYFYTYILGLLEGYDADLLELSDVDARFEVLEQDEETLIVSFIRFQEVYAEHLAAYEISYVNDDGYWKINELEQEILDEISPELTMEDIREAWHIHDPEAVLEELKDVESPHENFILYTVEIDFYDYSGPYYNVHARNVNTTEQDALVSNEYVGLIESDENNENDVEHNYVRPTQECEDDLYECYTQKLDEIIIEAKRRNHVAFEASDFSTPSINAQTHEWYTYYNQILKEMTEDLSSLETDWSETTYSAWLEELEVEIDEMIHPDFGTLAPTEAYSHGIKEISDKIDYLMKEYLENDAS